MHATWNALLKADRVRPPRHIGVIMTTGTLMGLVAVPFPAEDRTRGVEVPRDLGAGARRLLHLLLKAYSYGDLSHTYPIARGLGPLLVALASAA
jgi:hypothetical protein